MITREEAKELLPTYPQNEDHDEAHRIIDLIFDSIEPANCPKCKFFHERLNIRGVTAYKLCDKGISQCGDNFHCSLFVKK